jgi:hypothetical protein
VSDEQLNDLIGVYLDGRATEEQVRQLDQLVREDSLAGRELVLAAAMEAGLRQVLGGASAQGPAIAESAGSPELDAASVGGQGPGVPTDETGARPEVFQIRGLVLALPEDGDLNHAVRMKTGGVLPPRHKLWTCPWGGAGARYSDGTVVSMDRYALADFSEAQGVRNVELERGILSVNRWPAQANRGRMCLRAPLGSVTFDNAQVTLAIAEDQTVVEVAGGTVEFKRAADGKCVKISQGQYALVGSENELRAVSGALRWRIEPVEKGPR